MSIVLLNLNNYKDTRECLHSLREVRYPNFDVIVLDNGSADDSFKRLEKEFPDAKLLRSEKNLGFAGGNNLGIEEALRCGSDYVLLLNNDTVTDPAFLDDLVQVGETDSRIGILAPKIFYSSDPQRIWYAGGYVRFKTGICRHLGLNQIDRKGKFSDVADTQWVSGCAMMIKAEVLRRVGFLDDSLFVYWEDADFCMRAQKGGYRCVFVPTALVWHKISRTCGTESPFTLYLTTRNHLTWVARHVPFPYKPIALALTVGRKLVKGLQLAFDNRNSACAVWAGIWAFMFRISGPPRQERQPEESLSALA